MATSFVTDIQPLFTARDVKCMKPREVDLRSYEYMADPAADSLHSDHANARHVLSRLDGSVPPRMPMGAPAWPDERVALFARWIDEGCPP